ncbi:MAG: sporulation integral membrane protein YtvI [Oscillospiraceae bacterium]|nr:sporulation integral membrane protein YtvI [Oscillospiraceae bacterium]
MKKIYRILILAVLGVAGIWLTVRFALPIGLPFLCGWGLCRLARRPAAALCRVAGLPRWLSSLLCVGGVFLLLCGGLYLLGYVLLLRLQNLASRLPEMISAMEQPVEELYGRLLRLTSRLPDSVSHAAEGWVQELFAGGSGMVENLSQWLLDLVGRVLSCLPGLFLFLLATLLSAYLFSTREEKLRSFLRRQLPEPWKNRLRSGGRRLKSTLKNYFKAELKLCSLTFGLLAVGLFFIRDFSFTAIPIALAIAVVDALPVFGSGTVLIPWAVIAFLQGNSAVALGLLLLYAVAAVGRAFLEPKFLGKQMGLDPLVTLLCLYGGFKLFGIPGLILTPILAMVLLQLYDSFSAPA